MFTVKTNKKEYIVYIHFKNSKNFFTGTINQHHFRTGHIRRRTGHQLERISSNFRLTF